MVLSKERKLAMSYLSIIKAIEAVNSTMFLMKNYVIVDPKYCALTMSNVL